MLSFLVPRSPGFEWPARAKQGRSRFVGKKFEQFHVGPVEGQLLGKQTQDREDRDRLVRDTDGNKSLRLGHWAGALASPELNMALTTHHALKASIPQGPQQVIFLQIDSEGPKNLEGRGSAINSEQAHLFGAEEVGDDLAQALDRVFLILCSRPASSRAARSRTSFVGSAASELAPDASLLSSFMKSLLPDQIAPIRPIAEESTGPSRFYSPR